MFFRHLPAVRIRTSAPQDLQTQEQRRAAIAWAVALTAEAALAPGHYEGQLLAQYAQGTLTLSQVVAQLDTRVHHLLYHSQATQPLTPADLTTLVEESQGWNGAHGITGFLCYSSAGHFVQVLEGRAAEVHTLFARIRQDKRHHQVQVISDRATATRWFADWRMAFVGAELHEVYWLLGYREAQGHNLVMPHIPLIPSPMMTLVEAFSKI